MCAPRLLETESVIYLPTLPLELASPSGNRLDFEFKSRRTVSIELAASTTTRPAAWPSCPVVLSMKVTPVASP